MRSRLLWRRAATAAGLYVSVALGILATVVAARMPRPRRLRRLRDGARRRLVLPDAARPHGRGRADEGRLPVRRRRGLGQAAPAVRRRDPRSSSPAASLAAAALVAARTGRRRAVRRRRADDRDARGRAAPARPVHRERLRLARCCCAAGTTSAGPTRCSSQGLQLAAVAIGARYGVVEALVGVVLAQALATGAVWILGRRALGALPAGAAGVARRRPARDPLVRAAVEPGDGGRLRRARRSRLCSSASSPARRRSACSASRRRRRAGSRRRARRCG